MKMEVSKMESTDYKKLCLDLFGTESEAELRQIAEALHAKNRRHAGRKNKLTAKDIDDIKRLRAQGERIQDIAEKYHTTRQLISKYLSTPLTGSYTMRLTYMFGRTPCTTIDVDFQHRKIRIQNQTPNILHRAFGVNESPTWADFEQFLEDRCFPPTRGMMKETLADLGVDSYDPLQIIEITRGRVADDSLWLKIKYQKAKG